MGRIVRLEVERKFKALKIWQFVVHGGNPVFNSLVYLGHITLHDRYFDSQDVLSSHRFCVRKRNGSWQMKICRGDDRQRTQSEEVIDVESIEGLVRSLTGKHATAANDFSLELLAYFNTNRRSWTVDQKINIVIDRTDFGHEVGEVELERNLQVHRDDQVTRSMQEMDSQLARFHNRYQWAFDEIAPVGKLTAYLTTHNPRILCSATLFTTTPDPGRKMQTNFPA